MKNIHILPTDKPSRLSKQLDNPLVLYKQFIENRKFGKWSINQNIYITNDEEIKRNDYWINVDNNTISNGEMFELANHAPSCKKIILTTDQDLIKDGIQAIDDEFLEWFVKNPSCEEVEVERDSREVGGHNGAVQIEYGYYEIIIPKEEPCEHFTSTIGCIKDVCSCNKEPKKAPFKHKVKSLSTEEVLANRSNAYEFIDFEELKQETLEEAAEKSFKYIDHKNTFIAGAKWQEEQNKNNYSQLDVVRILSKYETLSNEDFNKWFEQFKK